MIGSVVQGISVNAIAGAIAEALHKASSSPVAEFKTTVEEQIPVKQGTQEVTTSTGGDELIPFVIGRPVYVLTVEYGGQTYNRCHEVSRRQEGDKPFDFESI